MAVDSSGNEVGKLFVGGLHQLTTDDSLRAYFAKFGDVEECVVMMDSRTGRSRGFGYIRFKDNDAVEAVLSQRIHTIDDKTVDAKKCNVNMKGKNRRTLKIFVGGIALEHDESVIRKFFSQHGTVTDVNLLSGPNKQRHRGFAFVGFDNEDVVKKLIDARYFDLDGKQVEVKAMEPPTTQRSTYAGLPGGASSMQFSDRSGRSTLRGSHYTQLHPGDSVAAATGWPSWAAGPGNWDGSAAGLGIANPSSAAVVPPPTWPPPSAWPGAPAGGGGSLVRPPHPGAAYPPPPPPQIAGHPGSAPPSAAGPMHWPPPPPPAAAADHRQQQHAYPTNVNGGWMPTSWASTVHPSSLPPAPLANNDMRMRAGGTVDHSAVHSQQQQPQQPSATQPHSKQPASWDSFVYAPMAAAAGSGVSNGTTGVAAGGGMHQMMDNCWPQPQQQQIPVAGGTAMYHQMPPTSYSGSGTTNSNSNNSAAVAQGTDWATAQWGCRDQRSSIANGYTNLESGAGEQMINPVGSGTMAANAALGLTNVGSASGAAAAQSSWAPPPPAGPTAVNGMYTAGGTDWRSTPTANMMASTGYHPASLQQQQHAYRC